MPTADADHRNGKSSPLRGVRVLVVEDGWEVANALKLLLEGMGAAVAGPAPTAAEAQRLATETRPDLAIVDVNLRGKMAYALMDWLNERGTRVVVISGYDDLPASLAKFAGTLHKPFTAAALLATLRQAMQPERTP